MRNVYAAMLALLLGVTSLHAQWTQTNGPAGAFFTGIVFDDGVVTASAGGALYQCTFLDTSWTRISTISLTDMRRRPSGVLIGSSFDRVTHARSTDNGRTWGQMPAQGLMVSSSADLYLNSSDSVYASSDDGATWELRGIIPWPSALSMAADSHVMFGASGYTNELARSTDGGHTWDTTTPSFVRQFNTVTRLFAVPGKIFAITQHVYATSDHGNTWDSVCAFVPPSLNWIDFDGRTLVAGTTSGIYRLDGNAWIRLSLPDGEPPHTFDTQGNLIVGMFSGLYQVPWNTSLGARVEKPGTPVATGIGTMAAQGPAVLASTGNSIQRSTNRGSTWQTTMPDISVLGLLSHRSAVFAMNPFHLYRSLDSGLTWTSADDRFQGTNYKITGMASDGKAAYLSLGSRYGEHGGELRWESGGVFRSTDNGSTWIAASDGLPIAEVYVPVMGLVATEQTLVISTVEGLFSSTTQGHSWLPANQGLPARDALEGSTFFTLGSHIYLLTATSPRPLLFVFNSETRSWQPVPIVLPVDVFPAWSTSGLIGIDDRIYLRITGDHEGTPLTLTVGFDGTTWTNGFGVFPLEVGPTCVVRNGDYLYLGTSGAGVWRSKSPQVAGVTVPVTDATVRFTATPNPVTDAATIAFTTREHARVTLALVNAIGETVATPFSAMLEPGAHTRTIPMQGLPSGMYIARLTVNGAQHTSVLIKR